MRKHILVVDDDSYMRGQMALILESVGLSTSQAGDGKQASEFLDNPSNPRVDLIILDNQMPVLDGLGFLRWLRGERKSSTPVLVASGIWEGSNHPALLEAGANSVAFKPMPSHVLLTQIDILLYPPATAALVAAIHAE